MAQAVRVNKPKGGTTTSASLFALYKEYDSGQINSQKFCERMESDVGVKVNSDFQNYIRTTQGQGRCEFRKIQQFSKVAQNKTQPVEPDVRPLDIKFHRGKHATQQSSASDRLLSPRSQPQNAKQEGLSQAIQAYTRGESNLGEFRLALAGSKVLIDGRIERLLRQHEAGDEVSYATLGTLIFRQLNGQSETYNRVDKISMNDPSQVLPANAFNTFSSPQAELPRRKKRVTDSMQMEDEWRNSTGVYQPTRGGVQRKDIFGSNLFTVINQEESRRTGGDREWQRTRKAKNIKHNFSCASNFGWDVAEPSSSYAGSEIQEWD